MLKHQLIHPKINEVLARAGHHALILIADGNYPVSTKRAGNRHVRASAGNVAHGCSC
jgi:L-fucose mutarotase